MAGEAATLQGAKDIVVIDDEVRNDGQLLRKRDDGSGRGGVASKDINIAYLVGVVWASLYLNIWTVNNRQVGCRVARAGRWRARPNFLDFRQMGTHVMGTVTTIEHVYVVADVSTCAEYMGSYGHEEHDEDV